MHIVSREVNIENNQKKIFFLVLPNIQYVNSSCCLVNSSFCSCIQLVFALEASYGPQKVTKALFIGFPRANGPPSDPGFPDPGIRGDFAQGHRNKLDSNSLISVGFASGACFVNDFIH